MKFVKFRRKTCYEEDCCISCCTINVYQHGPYVRKPEWFRIHDYIDGAFPSYGCEKQLVTLRCGNDVMDAVIDRFGKTVKVTGRDTETFEILETVAAGNAFYSWVFGFGGRIVITKPDSIREHYQKMIEMQYHSMVDT